MSLITDLQATATVKSQMADVLFTSGTAFQNLLTSWQHGVDLIWATETGPAMALAELGVHAAKVVGMHVATVTFLEGIYSGCTADRMTLIRPYTINADGTVTVDPVVEPPVTETPTVSA